MFYQGIIFRKMEDPTQNLHDITNEYYYQIGFLNGTSAHLVATTELNIWP